MLEKEIKSLMPHIKVMARKYGNLGVPSEDLENEGIFGIFKAKKHYDKSMGVNFNAYALWWIKQSILAALSAQSKLVHVPFAKINLFRKIKNVKDLYLQKYGREPTEKETKEELQINSQEYIDTLNSNSISIDKATTSTDVEDFSLINILTTPNEVEEQIELDFIKSNIKRAISKLTPREQFIINSFFGIGLERPLGLEEIGVELNLTRERCRQIKQESIKKLKKILPTFF